jgi:hypothetical protein
MAGDAEKRYSEIRQFAYGEFFGQYFFVPKSSNPDAEGEIKKEGPELKCDDHGQDRWICISPKETVLQERQTKLKEQSWVFDPELI